MRGATRERLIEIVADVQQLLYCWPGAPHAAGARASGEGTCAAKHAVLREELMAAGFWSSRLMVVGPLAPAIWPDLEERSGDLLEVHECLTVETDWAGPLLIDITWHPAAIRAGLRGTLNWDGRSDMMCAIEPRASYSVSDDRFRAQKELLRGRLYSPAQSENRAQILTEIARRATALD